MSKRNAVIILLSYLLAGAMVVNAAPASLLAPPAALTTMAPASR